MNKIFLIFLINFAILVSQGFAADAKIITIVFDATDDVIKEGTTEKPPKIYDSESCPALKSDSPPHLLSLRGECETNRFISKKGDKLNIVVWYTGDIEPEVAIKEESRSEQIGSDFSFLVAKIVGGPKEISAASGAKYKFIRAEHTLENTRANVTINVKYGEKQDDRHAIDYKSKTGPVEHWFMSVDMPVDHANRLKYDQASGKLVEKEVPSSFYIGLNYMLGDVLSENLDWYKQFHGKLMIKASEKPMDSFGFGLGYRFDELSYLIPIISDLMGDNKLGQTTIFAGYFWDKEDQIVNGVVKENNRYTNNWRVGISFALDKLSAWMK